MAKELIQILAQRPACTGSGIYLQSLYQAARQAGYNQAVIAAATEGKPTRDLNHLAEADFHPVLFNSVELPWDILGMSDGMPYPSNKYRDMDETQKERFLQTYSAQLEFVLAEYKSPVILSHHLWLLTARLAAEFPEQKIYAVCHGTGLRQIQKNPRFAREVKAGLGQVKKVFALNEDQKKLISQHFAYPAQDIVVTGLGYNAKHFRFPNKGELQYRLNKKTLELIYVGKLSEAKGLKSLFQALEIMGQPQLKLTLIGSGQGKEKEEIQKMAASVPGEVEFVGLLPPAEVAARMRKADVFCLPSYYEGFALVILEALASGLRVVCSDLPGVKGNLPDYITDSDVIQFVDLPPMEQVDQPVEEELPAYAARLAGALEHQVQLAKKLGHLADPDFLEAVQSLSWAGVFRLLTENF